MNTSKAVDVVSPLTPRRSHPAKHGEGFDAPPTIKRSGSEHRRAVTPLALLERARAWEWVKDPPPGEGQVGQITRTTNYFSIQFSTTIPLSLPMCLTFSVTITMLFMIAVVPIIMSASSIS